MTQSRENLVPPTHKLGKHKQNKNSQDSLPQPQPIPSLPFPPPPALFVFPPIDPVDFEGIDPRLPVHWHVLLSPVAHEKISIPVRRGAQQVKKYVSPTFRYQRIAWPITSPLAHYVRETPIWRFAEPARVAYRIIVPLCWMRTSTNAWDRLGTLL